MYRIRLTSGEEAVFRTVDELAMGIHSGVIEREALIYHKKSDKWLPIHLHPDYKAALAHRPAMAAELAFGPSGEHAAPARSPEEAPPVEVVEPGFAERAADFVANRVLQMESRSGRELMLRRKQASPLLFAGGGVVALVIFLALILSPRESPAPEATRQVDTTPPHPQPIALSPVGTPFEMRDTLNVATPAATPELPAVPTPEELAEHRTQGRLKLEQTFGSDLTKAGFNHLFTATRMGSDDSVRLTRRGLPGVRALLSQYREDMTDLEKTYQDSADQLIGAARWPLGGLTIWKSKAHPLETKEDAATADSLLGATEKLYALLLEEEGQYDNSEASISFNDADANGDYDRLRGVIGRLATVDTLQHPRARAVPLVHITAALTSPFLPPAIARAPAVPATEPSQ